MNKRRKEKCEEEMTMENKKSYKKKANSEEQ
jgi:hypothetical protein